MTTLTPMVGFSTTNFTRPGSRHCHGINFTNYADCPCADLAFKSLSGGHLTLLEDEAMCRLDSEVTDFPERVYRRLEHKQFLRNGLFRGAITLLVCCLHYD